MAGPENITGSLRRGLRYFYGEQHLSGFAGGLNVRDSWSELAPNESPDLWNVTLDERGGVVKRLGYSKWNAAAAANLFTYGYYSKVVGKLLFYSAADGKLYSDPGTGVLTLRRTWTSGSAIQMVDFAGSCYAIHPVDGLYSSADGVTWSIVTATSGTVPKGSLLAAWQNKLWTAGDVAAGRGVRLTFCAAGDATKWASADGGGTVDIREKDDAPIVALFGGSGFDQQTKPALVVFKSDSTYRVTDSTTGAYLSIDMAVGAASANSVTSRFGNIYVLSTAGIFETTGLSQLKPIGQKLQPLFSPAALAYDKSANFCAGAQGDRVYFSVSRSGSASNDLMIELDVLFGSFTASSNAMRAYVTYTANAETLIGASPTVAGQLYKMNSLGSDDGAAITSWFATRIFEPLAGHSLRMREINPVGRGAFTLTTRADWSQTGGVAKSVSIANAGALYGTGVYGVGLYGGSSSENYATTRPLNVGRAFQVRIDETSSLTASAPKLLDNGVALTVGAWALYSLDMKYVPLGSG